MTMDGPKLMKKADSRAADRWITDMLTSVFTTTDITVNTVFGPCDLNHSSLYDSIAFIALKCSDRRTTPYTLKVDISSASSESPHWLQQVQSARDAEEQNLEAYVKDGQLFFRALRTVKQGSELLAWYKKDLSQLLSLISDESKGVPPYMCPFCKQGFQFEFPLLAHQRFLCKERFLSLTSDRVSKVSLHSGDKPATDFHNLARDLEKGKAPSSNTETGGPAKRRHSEMEGESRDENVSASLSQGDNLVKKPCVQRTVSQLRIPVPHRQSILNKTSTIRTITDSESQLNFKGSDDGTNTIGSEGFKHVTSKPKKELMVTTSSSGTDACSTKDSTSSGEGVRKSAFVQPPRSLPQSHPMVMTLPAGLPQLPLASSKLQSSALLQATMHKQGSLLLNTTAWARPLAPTPLLRKAVDVPHALISCPLSPISPLGLPAQNWCAKCSISFHMTSDLVQHMRSHHKRALPMEQGAQQKRGDRLKCHICKESFRERHHLSRHMTSHT